MAERLTERLVKALPAPAGGNKITYDEIVAGFGLRVTAAGAKSFVLNYRINRRERRYTIGAWPDWTVAAAREEAKRRKRQVDLGEDPLGRRIAAREAPTMVNLCDDYLERHAPTKRTGGEDRRKIERLIKPRLGRRLVAEVTMRDIEDFHRSKKATPNQANRYLALLSKMFSLAIKWEWRVNNPCQGIEKFPEEKRQRYLTADEISRLIEALAEYPHQTSVNAIRLLMLTGARRGEVLKATWDQFDLDRGEWLKPSSHTKTKLTHRVPLSPPAIELLTRIKSEGLGDYVFPGKVADKPLTDVKRCWAAVCKKAELEGVRVHDLRHTYASILASSGRSLLVIGRLLGHTQPGTTSRYAHLYDDPLREATSRVAAFYDGVAGNGESGEVVRLAKDGVK